MNRDSRWQRQGLRSFCALCLGLTLAQISLGAENVVTRQLKSVDGGYEVTLTWSFSAKVESDLVIEERLLPAEGWSADPSSVNVEVVDTLDADWFHESRSKARFAINPTNAVSGKLTFQISGTGDGKVAGEWYVYYDGRLQRGEVKGDSLLPPIAVTSASPLAQNLVESGNEQSGVQKEKVEQSVAVKSFKMLEGSRIELSYGGLPADGELVVEGCENLGKAWTEIKRLNVKAGDGTVELGSTEVNNRRFMRMKLLTEEQK